MRLKSTHTCLLRARASSPGSSPSSSDYSINLCASASKRAVMAITYAGDNLNTRQLLPSEPLWQFRIPTQPACPERSRRAGCPILVF